MKVIQGIVDLSNLSLRSIPEILKDVEVHGSLYLNQNNLTNLNNCPRKVLGVFKIGRNNKLKSLVGAPIEVHGVDAYGCKLESLEGFPKLSPRNVNDQYRQQHSIILDENELKSLVGLPSILHAGLYVSNNPLETLKGSPRTVEGDCSFEGTNIKSLEGCPSIIQGDLYLENTFLENTSFWPKEVRGNIYIGNTPLADKLFPTKMTMKSKFEIDDIFKSINAICKIGGDIYEYESDVEDEENVDIEMDDYDYEPDDEGGYRRL